MLTTLHSAASQTLWPEHLDLAIGASLTYDAITAQPMPSPSSPRPRRAHRESRGGHVMSANSEQARLADDGGAWKRWGPYLSERAWGTVREDYSEGGTAWEYLPTTMPGPAPTAGARTASAGLSDDQQLLCFGLGLLERRRPDPQGADLRAHRQRGQPRRGRQGAVVVPRLDADALVDALGVPLPAARVPVRTPGRREPSPWPARPRVRAARHRHLRRRPLLGHHRRLRQGRARTTSVSGCGSATPGQTRPHCTCCRRCGSAIPGRGASTTASRSIVDQGRRPGRRAPRPRSHGVRR